MSTAAGTRFQGGPSCEIFSPQGTDPLRKQGVGVHGRVGLEFDKSIKSYALVCNGGTTCKVDFPGAKAKRKNLALTQRYLAIQLSLPAAADPFGLELTVADAQRTRRRLVISSAFRNIVAHPLHVQLPLGAAYEPHFGDREINAERADEDTVVPRGIWLTLCLDMQELVASNFSGINFRALEALSISGTSKVRRVFTLKDPPPAMNMPVKPSQKLAPIPRQLQFLGTMETSPPTIFFTMAAVHAWEEIHGAEHRHSPRSQPQKLARTRRPGDRPPVSARSSSTLGAGSTTSATPRTRRLLQTRRAPEATPPETRDEEDSRASHEIDAAANFDEEEDDGSTILTSKRSSGETRGETERILPALARAKQGVAQPTRPKFTLDLPIREERPSSRQDKLACSSRAKFSARERRETTPAVLSTNQEQQEEEEEDIALNEYAANSPSSPVAAISRAQVTQGDAAVDSDSDGEFGEEDRPRGQSVETDAKSLTDDLADRDEYQTRPDNDEENNLSRHPRAPSDADVDSSHGGDALSDNDEIFLDGGNDEIGADDLDASREEDDDLELSAVLEPTSSASENRLRDRLVQEREELARMEARIAAEEDKLLDARRREREADDDAVADLSEHERTGGEESTAKRDDLAALSDQVLQTTISDALQNLASTSEDSTNGQRTASIDYASNDNAGKEKEEEEEDGDLDLVFDPILECYFCPKTNKYYKMK